MKIYLVSPDCFLRFLLVLLVLFMNILITGGCGFIGTNLAAHFATKYNVTAFDSLTRPGSEKNADWLHKTFGPKIKIIAGEITDAKKIAALVKGKDAVLHLAAQVAVTRSVIDPLTDFEVNLRGTMNVLEAARKQKHMPIVTYASTNKVYGDIESRPGFIKKPVMESQPLDFFSPYACSKGSADSYVHDYFRIYKLPTVVFRKSCIYGIHQYGSEDQGWVAYFVRRALADKPITIYGDGRQTRDLLYIDDLISLYETVITNPLKSQGQIFNVGGGNDNAVDLLGLIHKLEKILKRKIKIKFESARAGDQHYYVSDITKVKKVMGWNPKVGVETGLNILIKWAKTTI
jgi:CDP-paratose 2-epimerase